MANSLSLLLRLKVGANPAHTAQHLAAAFTPKAEGDGPNILHYAWAVAVPQISPVTILLSTVYDEAFDPYIRDLVTAHPEEFDKAAPGIEGMAELVPIEDHLDQFVAFVKAGDLTDAGDKLLHKPMFCGYTNPAWTVDEINLGMGPAGAAGKSR